MLSVNGRSLEYRDTRVDRGSVRLTKGGSRAESCDEVCPKVVRDQSPAMIFAQGWIVSKVLQSCLPKGGSQTKSCDDVCPRVDRQMAKGRLCDDT